MAKANCLMAASGTKETTSFVVCYDCLDPKADLLQACQLVS